jgi:hypothetical protein
MELMLPTMGIIWAKMCKKLSSSHGDKFMDEENHKFTLSNRE